MKKKKNEDKNKEVFDGLTIISKPDMNILRYDNTQKFEPPYITNIENIKQIKRLTNWIRPAWEYSNYTKYLRSHLDFTKCAFLQHVNTDIHGVKIEIHHSPFTLFDITTAVANKHIIEYGYADEFKVADEVLLLHYKNLVGLIPVSKTIHELIHSQEIDVQPRYTYGYWKEFCNQYKQYFTEELLLKYNDLIVFDRQPDYRIPNILRVKYTVIQIGGAEMYGLSENIKDKNQLLLDGANIENLNHVA